MNKLLAIAMVAMVIAPAAAGAVSLNSVVINEIAWMGTANSASDEWIELKNNSADVVNVDGWTLKSLDGKLKATLKGSIAGNDFYLLERSDNNSVPGIAANIIYKGALSNAGANIALYDTAGNMVDGVNFPGGWPKGDKTTKQTMERKDDGSWQTSKSSGGTPKAQNSTGNIAVATSKSTTPATKKTSAVLSKTTKADSKNSEVSTPAKNAPANPFPADTSQANSNPWILFATALGISIISGIILLLIKLKLGNSKL